MSILGTSPTAIRVMDMNISNALGSLEAALILQQLHYWMEKQGVGVIVENAKYIYNTFEDWVSQQFTFLTIWKFRKAMKLLRSLEIVNVVRYKAKEWNQTNYYSLNYERLREWAEAESIEISEMCNNSPQDEETQTFEMRNSNSSLNRAKDYTKKETTNNSRDRISSKLSNVAASPKKGFKREKKPKQSNPRTDQLTAVPSQIEGESENKELHPNKEKEVAQVDVLVNSKWRSLIPELDKAGIPINKTLKDLLKLYPKEKVESAIALLRARKREKYVANPSGYFIKILEGDWATKSLVGGESGDGEVDQGAVFRHWYDLARELGYCSGQEVREEEQWVCLSGSWEKWSDAVERGYSLEYLKKIMKRNQQ